MYFCSECGARLTPGNKFCGNCGALQSSDATGAPDANDTPTGIAAAATPAAFAASSSSSTPPRQHTVEGYNAALEATIIGTPANLPSETLAPPARNKESNEKTVERAGHVAAEGRAHAEAVGVASGKQATDSDQNLSQNANQDALQAADEATPQASGASLVAATSVAPERESAPVAASSVVPESISRESEDGGVSNGASSNANSGAARSAGESGESSSTVRGGSTGGGRGGSGKQLEPDTVLNNRYEVVRRIGGGGMGAVYLAKDRNLGDAPRAVKEMIQSQLDEAQHEKAIADFKRESMLLSRLEHNSIPTIYDYFYDDAAMRFYLVMKYIAGGDFLSRLRNAPNARLDEKTVTDWACQTADVLDYLHSQNPPIIYRDLKPANLMIDGTSGRVMLIDFGIARWVTVQEKGVTAVGTMGYAPPELFSGKVEARSDVYSLGATMFHMLTGADPQENPLLIFDFTKHPPPRQINPGISVEMERILMRAVQYKPEDRFASAREMRDVLADHLEKIRNNQIAFGADLAANDRSNETVATEMVYCGFCGGRIAANDLFCAHCGAKQPLAGAASAALHQARATARLVVAGTTQLEQPVQFQLQKEISNIGRNDPHSNIFPEIDLSHYDPNTKVSRKHARIFRRGDSFLVEDLNSVNGTVVNEKVKLAPFQPRALASGDKLRLGETTLHFLVE